VKAGIDGGKQGLLFAKGIAAGNARGEVRAQLP